MRASAVRRRVFQGAACALLWALVSADIKAAPDAPATDAARLGLRSLAATCANCHGTDGRPADTTMAPLAGLPQTYIAAQMRAFQSGERPATVMHQISRGYSAAQIDALAGYFSSLPGAAGPAK